MLLDILKIRRTYKSLTRVRQILNVFFKHGFGQFIERLNLNRFVPFSKRIKIIAEAEMIETSLPERLMVAFTELGPSFIKLGQLLSSRPDLITEKYANEFKKLQDEVPPFPFESVKKIIESDTGKSLSDIFKSIVELPVAAASIAQVHNAVLTDGTKVVVKVQRPDIKKVIENDLNIMKTISGLMIKYLPEAELFNPLGIVEEFSKTIKKELNFIEEIRNMERFRRNLKIFNNVVIPVIYPELTSDRVIIMERIEGIRIDNISSIEKLDVDRKEIARTYVNVYFKMILEDGFFHADPHPGNIFIMPDGKIGIVDFGIVGWLSPEIMEKIAGVLSALVNKDFNSLVEQLIELGMTHENTDTDLFRQKLMADVANLLVPLYDLPLAEVNFAEILDTILLIVVKHKLQLPSTLLLVDKCILMVDGIVRNLDPDFNFIDIASPYAARLIRKKYTPKYVYDKLTRNISDLSDSITYAPKQIRILLRRLVNNEFSIKIAPVGIEGLKRDLDRSTNRLSFSIIIGSIIMGSSLLTFSGVGIKLFDLPLIGLAGFTMAFVLGVWLLISILRSGRL